MKTVQLLSAIVLSTLAALTAADTLELKNGKVLEGTFISRDGDTISFDVGGIPMTMNASDVKSISMRGAVNPQAADKSESAKPAAPVEIPAGTQFTLRLNETLDTGKHKTGHKFTAVLEGALVSQGVTVAPQGSRIYGVISEAVKSRRVVGKTKMMLTVTDINIDGQMVPIVTSGIDAQTQATAKNSVSKVARGAAIGGLVDGSSGAKTGAKVGVAGAVLSGGNQVVIPAGTFLDFTLVHALKQG